MHNEMSIVYSLCGFATYLLACPSKNFPIKNHNETNPYGWWFGTQSMFPLSCATAHAHKIHAVYESVYAAQKKIKLILLVKFICVTLCCNNITKNKC